MAGRSAARHGLAWHGTARALFVESEEMMMMKIRAEELSLDMAIYPRESVNEVHVNALADALRCGALLPPLIVDRKSKRIIDGVHRWKAWRKVKGESVEIDCVLRKYLSEAELFKDAIALNADHGLRYTPFEHTRCVLRAEEMGISRAEIAAIIRVPLEKLERRVESKTGFRRIGETVSPEPLKRSLEQLAGRPPSSSNVVAFP